jgi:hypothetical protein
MSNEIEVINPMSLLSQAVSSNMPIESLERLVALQERWEAKQSQKAFFEAMNNFQENKPRILKENAVSHDKGVTNKYFFASLSSIQEKIDPVASKFGLSYSWEQEEKEGKHRVFCVIKHVDGHSERNYLESILDNSGGKNAIQSLGSVVSYLKRYTLCNGFGLSSADDDGASATMSANEVNGMALDKLKRLIEEKKGSLDEKTLNRLAEITANEESASYKKAINTLTKI